jgi:hypothetical protein
VNVADLQPRRHDPPGGWDSQTFEQITDAIAAALVAAVRRQEEESTTEAQKAVVQ